MNAEIKVSVPRTHRDTLSKKHIWAIQQLTTCVTVQDISNKSGVPLETIRDLIKRAKKITDTHSAAQLVAYCFRNRVIK